MSALAFCRADSLSSYLIRLATWSPWSHVALVEGDNVIDATLARGVAVSALSDFEERHDEIRLIQLSDDFGRQLAKEMASQLGKPYDWRAVVGLELHRDWQDDSSWFCSELVAAAFEWAGHPLFRAETMHRVTPQHLWMLRESFLGL